MSDYEKQDEDDEYLQNVENFEDPASSPRVNFEDFKRTYGGRDFDVEETIGERFLGLTEMFPNCIRNAGEKFVNFLDRCLTKTYRCACNLSWIAFASTTILCAPVVYEYERSKDAARIQQRRGKTQGPNIAMTS